MEDVKYRYHDNDHLSVLRRAEENPDVIRDFQFDGESAETLKLGMSQTQNQKIIWNLCSNHDTRAGVVAEEVGKEGNQSG